jgi:hypothetical protein
MEQIKERMVPEMKAGQEEMKAEIRANNEKIEVLRGTFVSTKPGHKPCKERGRPT